MKITFFTLNRRAVAASRPADPPASTAPGTPRRPTQAAGKRLIAWAARLFSRICLILVPVMPALVALLLMDRRFLADYGSQRAKFKTHFLALSQGPVEHFFSDVFLRFKQVPVTVYGECVQCGNCCLNRQCAFLEPLPDGKYQCGIYGTYLRRLSNCGSFPLHAHDIARYQCPSYFVEGDPRVLWLKT